MGRLRKSSLGVSDLARRIILDERPDSHERVQLVKEAALRPKLHKDLWEKWASNLPSDANIEYHLLADRGFNEKTVGGFIAGYKASLDFAGLINDGKLADDESGRRGVESATSRNETRNALTPRSGMKQDTYTLEEGDVVIQWPARLSQESYKDLEVWLKLMASKMQRAVAIEADQEHERTTAS